MRRVVVTGIGMVSPLATGAELTWKRLLEGKSGASKIEHFQTDDLPAKVACMVKRGDGSDGTFNADQWMDPKDQRRVDTFIVFAVAAADQAIADSGLSFEQYEDQIAAGTLIGSGIGGLKQL